MKGNCPAPPTWKWWHGDAPHADRENLGYITSEALRRESLARGDVTNWDEYLEADQTAGSSSSSHRPQLEAASSSHVQPREAVGLEPEAVKLSDALDTAVVNVRVG